MDTLKADKTLKEIPYSVPEGYFSDLSRRISIQDRERHVAHKTLRQVLAPYAAMAAMFAIIAFAGKGIIKYRAHQEGQIENEEFYYSEVLPLTWISGEFYEDSGYEYIAESNTSDIDILEYLIHSGISIEEISIEYE